MARETCPAMLMTLPPAWDPPVVLARLAGSLLRLHKGCPLKKAPPKKHPKKNNLHLKCFLIFWYRSGNSKKTALGIWTQPHKAF